MLPLYISKVHGFRTLTLNNNYWTSDCNERCLKDSVLVLLYIITNYLFTFVVLKPCYIEGL